jgi:hypothetical protein
MSVGDTRIEAVEVLSDQTSDAPGDRSTDITVWGQFWPGGPMLPVVIVDLAQVRKENPALTGNFQISFSGHFASFDDVFANHGDSGQPESETPEHCVLNVTGGNPDLTRVECERVTVFFTVPHE